jgi:hypothetical protein
MVPCSYEFIAAAGQKRHGVIAQELTDNMPELVRMEGPEQMLAVCYQDMTACLVSAVQALSAKIEVLEELYAASQ